ncbi:TPA: retron Ec67 family RNA-directed DNA polymerase/endonuclease [Pseudomonas aeruginosa]|uniref:retron Ec67 family RNA-directed DNA polymerase/endonuclease n=1 Tax=Pseudomonas aeruginosa TaxID=287 RepID=UPI0003B9B588|nr:retron Ec67 family RNA-directed DNA polymerase/endonuclease [Pseudomonas aeruginosa]EKU8591290.1 retron Ec67 family RNA-directed DNA polymerase/endonuclease [Pseudomonas aeruginosa]EKX5153059.1 retron Ec67 family RNA-directed DNA polymerase/endonuclease [Pseudomonas aeruginosa]ELT9254576.1 retron Ec67 family RNA-directed DNA polymerase/endonuclease [Pseudomonas aeruginosa]ERW56606.1 hypothetical protein Q027_00156 [Pseudomonas aeruginosa BWHPSA014]PHP75514.1 RNA-directed DNA polymerase [Pse
MLSLNALQTAQTLHDLAHILNYEPKFLSYILYKKPVKYSHFTIPKSSGAPRDIAEPCEELKALQRKVKELLEVCLKTINNQKPQYGSLSHGFKKDHSIITNAYPHRKKRFVFNVDISDFFGSIHVGRVRGFFITNRDFRLSPKVATILAQIICHEDALPQGAPTSPITSDLIGHLIDIRLVEIAERYKCVYSRYADDITFSSNEKNFPSAIAFPVEGTTDWIPGRALLKAIHKCGFGLNHNKTRMLYRESQQTVTGLVVNQKVNPPATYRRQIRAALHKLFLDGQYFLQEKPRHSSSSKVDLGIDSLEKIEGMLSYVYMVDKFNRSLTVETSKSKKEEEIPKTSLEKLHGDFLFYKYFYAASKPTIICEGKTDNVYLTCAIKSLYKNYPELAKVSNDELKLNVKFINYSDLTHRVMGLNGGTGDIANLIRAYAKQCGKYKAHPPLHPTIVVLDNDSGSQQILNAVKDLTTPRYDVPNGKGTKLDTTQDFYKIAQNLYMVLTPLDKGKSTMMENFFPTKVLNTIYKGKTFEILKKSPPDQTYSKHIFAQHIVKAEQKKIDFVGFSPILDSITKAIKDYPTITLPKIK